MVYRRETGPNGYQSHVIERIRKVLPGCVILKNDPTYLQGIPDLSIFYGSKYAMLECKRCEAERHQPNQDYYIHVFSQMTFATFIYPENEEHVIPALVEFMNDNH